MQAIQGNRYLSAETPYYLPGDEECCPFLALPEASTYGREGSIDACPYRDPKTRKLEGPSVLMSGMDMNEVEMHTG
jgi:hypothetical protein